MLQQLPAFLVFQSSAGPLPVQQLTERAGYFRDRQTSIIPCDLPDQLQLLPCKDAPTKTQRNSSPPPRLLGWRRVTRYGHGWIAAEALSISHGRTCQANSTGTVPSPRDGERDRAGSTVSAKAAEERACVRQVGGTSARIWLLSGVTNNSISTSREFFPCSVSAPVLARHHQRTQSALGTIIGRIQTWTIEKSKQVRPFPTQMLGQPAVGGILIGSRQPPIQLDFQASGCRPQTVG